MARSDPYPRQELLGPKELMSLLAMDRSTWYEFLQDPTTRFPPAVVVGKTKNGKPRLRWRKWQVYAWIDLLQEHRE